MDKDDKINIKLEVCRDKASGKLSLLAHFDSNAPNIFEEKDGIYWLPTIEEKDLLADAFEFMPLEGSLMPSVKTSPKPEKIEEEKPPEPVIEEEVKPAPEINEDEIKPADLPPLEKPNDPDIFEVTDENIKKDDIKKDNENETDEQTPEEPKSDESETEEEDKGIIVEADSDAIEAALKKHTDKDDELVEADEQTIIDKVLSQKKKGKWSKR